MNNIINFIDKHFKRIGVGITFVSILYLWSLIVGVVFYFGSRIFQVGFTFDQVMEFCKIYIFLFLVCYCFGLFIDTKTS